MAQDTFINLTASTIKAPDGRYAHKSAYGSASSGDFTLSFDSTKFATRQHVLDAVEQVKGQISQISSLK